MRTLTSGVGKWRLLHSRRKSHSRSLRVRSREASEPIGNPSTFAWRIARRSSLGGTAPRKSTIVCAGFVTGIPCRLVIAAGGSAVLRCRRSPDRRALPASPGTEMSIGLSIGCKSPHNSAALRWLTAALSPQARAAPSTSRSERSLSGPPHTHPDGAGVGGPSASFPARRRRSNRPSEVAQSRRRRADVPQSSRQVGPRWRLILPPACPDQTLRRRRRPIDRATRSRIRRLRGRGRSDQRPRLRPDPCSRDHRHYRLHSRSQMRRGPDRRRCNWDRIRSLPLLLRLLRAP